MLSLCRLVLEGEFGAAAKSCGCGDLRPWSLRVSCDFEANLATASASYRIENPGKGKIGEKLEKLETLIFLPIFLYFLPSFLLFFRGFRGFFSILWLADAVARLTPKSTSG